MLATENVEIHAKLVGIDLCQGRDIVGLLAILFNWLNFLLYVLLCLLLVSVRHILVSKVTFLL